jgi:Na+-transporting NADH:ubiquinone oxidoreductase subunit NqrC
MKIQQSTENKKMKKTLKKTFAISAISAMLIACSLMALVQAQSTQSQVGKDLASEIREIAQTHKAQETKLAIVDEYVTGLKTKIDEAKAARTQLISDLQAGKITEEEFEMQMKAIALCISDFAKTMGTLGKELDALEQSTKSSIKENVDELVTGLQGSAGEMRNLETSIAEEMSGRKLPIPELPDVSQKPNTPGLANRP